MSCRPSDQGSAYPMPEEHFEMRIVRAGVLVFLTLVAVWALIPVASASAASPWWQVLTGSRPTYLWEPADNVQEIDVELSELGAAIQLEVKGKVVACLGAELAGE